MPADEFSASLLHRSSLARRASSARFCSLKSSTKATPSFPLPEILLLVRLNAPSGLHLCHGPLVPVAPFRRCQVCPTHPTQDEIFTAVFQHVEKSFIGLNNFTFEVPDEDTQNVRINVGEARRQMFLDETDLLIKATWLYHHRNLTQGEIARQLGFSRPKIVRLLRQAAEQGLVTISLRADALSRVELSAQLVERFGLREAFIVPTVDGDTEEGRGRAVGKAGALYLEANLRPEQIFAVTWRRTVLEVALALRDHPVRGLVVAQTLGGLNSEGSFDPSRVTSLFAEKLHARTYHLYVPAIVATKELRNILLADPGVRLALDMARKASCLMVGIGKPEIGATVVETGFLDSTNPRKLVAQGAVGDITAGFFDINGKRVFGEVDDRVIGLSWEDIESLENVIGVACGTRKTEAILGALRTGLLDVLITDDRTAAAVLKAASK
jgi:DNA-binding transcriptional regulator LsrR (DeoR family)